MKRSRDGAAEIGKGARRRLAFFFALAAGLVGWLAIAPVSAAPPTSLRDVRSFLYLVDTNTKTPGLEHAIASAPQDLIILGGVTGARPFDRKLADPQGRKLILDYLDLTEASPWETPELFDRTHPDWFGGRNPDWPNIYSVRYWTPAWRQALFRRLDEIKAQGYDGAFLDVASGDTEWSNGNPFGNPPYPDAAQALARLLGEVRAHVDSWRLGRPFFLLANNPQGVALAAPEALSSLDGIFSECLYHCLTASKDVALPAASRRFILETVAPAYARSGLPVFASEYLAPTDPTAAEASFQAYAALGWIPSGVIARGGLQTISRGPYIATAKPTRPQIEGRASIKNYLSGGSAASASLRGGDQGDVLIGGPGANTIVGGAGDDLIFAHPAAAAEQGRLSISLKVVKSPKARLPGIKVLIDGKPSRTWNTLAGTNPTQPEEVDLDLAVPPLTRLKSLRLEGVGTYYTSAQDFAVVTLRRVRYEGLDADLKQGAYSTHSGYFGGVREPYLSGGGSAEFGRAAFPASPAIMAGAQDEIDGGGGRNTVVYGGPACSYRLQITGAGSAVVTGLKSGEGPDRLIHVALIRFSDRTVAVSPGRTVGCDASERPHAR
ncbi:endo alpha-1,4 polygalactosaminidase [Phenylobacterium montanum]|uniref:Endo alpha-1,4 polygalactosaminidase n=1 Tax=Phenylobacterium montanum TaxID=2823693 RepID=A0A975IVR9_9CAUL|nr:endo alpha-1,4 polygalactosaminidase [Caulobacter sp. S6]QUD89297.1 endo alpha-1,4 polygalactosaminidase [Caulobacter sp. S6]